MVCVAAQTVMRPESISIRGVLQPAALKRDQFFRLVRAVAARLPGGHAGVLQRASLGRRLRAMGLDARHIAAHFVIPYRMKGKSGTLSPCSFVVTRLNGMEDQYPNSRPIREKYRTAT